MGQIERTKTLEEAIVSLQARQTERILREARYCPAFTGCMKFGIVMKNGIPILITEEIDNRRKTLNE